jgi:uncharacterized protein YndB with AHSA1/START domain
MLRILTLIIVVLVSALALFVATRPSAFRIQRSVTITAPPEKIYPHIVDFHAWPAWSPWEKIDPALQRTYGGPTSGPGAVYEWTGNKDIGQGRMEILEAAPSSRGLIKLDFLAPFEAHNTAEFTLQANGDGTSVTWAMYGPNTLMGKVMSLFFNMESMVGPQFETGLSNLKALAER